MNGRIRSLLLNAAALALLLCAPASAGSPGYVSGHEVGAITSKAKGKAKDNSRSAMPTARVVSCKPAAKYDDRSVEFEGRMKSSAGLTPEMKFTLYSKPGKERRFKRVKLSGLDVWQRPAETNATVFRFRQAVRSLQSPAQYKAVVRFRWIDGDGKTVRRVTRKSPVCKMKAPAPELRVDGIDVAAPAADGSTTYFVFIANKGRGEARNVRVWIRRPDSLFGTETIPTLESGDSQIVSFVGMPCTRWVEAEIDPMKETSDYNRSNNLIRKDCD